MDHAMVSSMKPTISARHASIPCRCNPRAFRAFSLSQRRPEARASGQRRTRPAWLQSRCAAAASSPAAPQFSLETSVILAAAAFEAYLEPAEETGIKDVSVTGTETRFFNEAFVRENYAGTLDVQITGKSDPYVICSCGQSSATTNWKFQDLNPVWNERFSLWVEKPQGSSSTESDRPPTSERLKISVRDKDFLGPDDDLGVVFVSLGDLQPGQATRLELELRGPKAGNGVVVLQVTYRPFGSGQGLVSSAMGSQETELAAGSPEEAMKLGSAASALASAGDSEMRAAWDSLCSLFCDSVLADKQTIAYVESPATDTQAWISRDSTLKKVVISFRGTEQVKWKDFVSDVNLVPADMNIEGAQEASLFSKLISGVKTPTVHSGFYDAWKSVRVRVLSVVDACTGGDTSWQVYVTGHSLGGALATLAAFTLATRTGKPKYKVTMYNYGAPRVGNAAFAGAYADKVLDSWRVHNHADIVAAMPRLMGYCHVPNGVRISERGKLVLMDRQGVDILGEGRNTMEVFEELTTKLQDEVTKEELITGMYDHEMKLLESLKGGEALSTHMEDFYLESLLAIISDEDAHQGAADVMAAVRKNIECFRAAAIAEKEK